MGLRIAVHVRTTASIAVGLLLASCLVLVACSGGAESSSSTTSATTGSISPTTPSATPINLAATAGVTVSNSLPGQPAAMVNDGIHDVASGNFWGSGGMAPQWVEFDLGTTATIVRLELLISQSPSGDTTHEILGRGALSDDWVVLENLRGATSDGETLVVVADPAWGGIRYMRIQTSESPSWVSWGEVIILGIPDREVVTPSTVPDRALPETGPDLILHGGIVITVDSAFSLAEAVAVDRGVIVAVGGDSEVLALRSRDTVVIDLAGATVMPGIVDPHIHMIQREVPDQAAMGEAQNSIIQSGRTTIGIPGANSSNLPEFGIFKERAILRIHLYVTYNTNCGEPPVEPDLWRSVAFDPVTDQVAVVGVKVFADGGSCMGPAVSWEYPDPLPPNIGFIDWTGRGSLFISAEELADVVRTTDARGGQTVVHVAGDRAIVTALEGMEQALQDFESPLRHRLDHNDFVPPEHRSRYSELGVVPVVFGDYDSCFESDGMWSLLAPESALGYHRANRSMIEANPDLPIAWHSDLPFTVMDIFAQMQFLVTVAEVTEDGTFCDPPDFLADQGVDIDQAIRMMTWNSAYAMGLEEYAGSLEEGKWADLIIIERNPLEAATDEVHRNNVWATLIGGSVAYCAGPQLLCASFGE